MNELTSINGEELKTETKTKTKEKLPDSIRVEMHPTTIFGVKVEKEKTESGIILPEGYGNSKGETPIVKIIAIGDDVQYWEQGDYVYVNPRYMEIAKLDGVYGVVLMADGIFARVKQTDEEDCGCQ